MRDPLDWPLNEASVVIRACVSDHVMFWSPLLISQKYFYILIVFFICSSHQQAMFTNSCLVHCIILLYRIIAHDTNYTIHTKQRLSSSIWCIVSCLMRCSVCTLCVLLLHLSWFHVLLSAATTTGFVTKVKDTLGFPKLYKNGNPGRRGEILCSECCQQLHSIARMDRTEKNLKWKPNVQG